MMAWAGGVGAGFAALCCFTGLLPFLLTALGLTSLVPLIYRDSVLFPVFGICLIIMGVGLWLWRKTSN